MTDLGPRASDEELIALWQSDPAKGDDCFQALYNLHREHTYRFYFKLTRNEELSKDLNQSLYTELLTAYRTFTGKGRFLSWLFQIARNIFYDTVIRPQSNKKVMVNPGIFAETLEIADRTSRRPDRQMDKTERLECFLACFEELPMQEKAVLVDHYFHGEPVVALTKRMKLDNPSGARKYKVRALRLLRSSMFKRMEKDAQNDKGKDNA